MLKVNMISDFFLWKIEELVYHLGTDRPIKSVELLFLFKIGFSLLSIIFCLSKILDL